MGGAEGAGAAGAGVPYWRLSGFYLLFFAVTGAMLPFLPPYIAARGLDAAEIGMALAVMTAAKVIAPNLWGYVADRSGRRLLVVRVGVVASAIAMLGLAGPGGFWWLVVVLGLYGLVSNAVLPQFEVVTLAHLGERSADYARIRVWGSVGFIAAVTATGWWTERHGLAALPAILVTLLSALALAALLVPAVAVTGRAAGPVRRLASVARRPAVLAFLAASLLMAASHGPYYAFFTIHLQTLGYGGDVVGVLWAIAVVAEVVLFIRVPGLLRRFSLQQLLLWCFALTAARWALMALAAQWLVPLAVGQLLHAVSFGLFHACAIAFVRAHFTAGTEGRGQALYSSISFGLGGAIGVLGAGLVWASSGAHVSFAMAALACLLGCALLARWPAQAPAAGQ